MIQAKILGHINISGWVVAHMLLPKGAKYHSIVTGRRTREDIGYKAIWLKGHISVRNLSTGENLEPRKPYLISSSLPPLSIGRIEFEAKEDTEWLCFDKKLNRGLVPEVLVIDEPKNNLVSYDIGNSRKLFVSAR